MTIDLHTHTTASDGSFTPEEIIERAHQNNIKALAITDHDTVSGLDEAMRIGKKYGIEVIPGIEFSTRYMKEDVHIVGLYIDWHNDILLKELEEVKRDRETRNQRMVNRLQELGYAISFKEAEKLAGGDILTRAHFAKLLVNKGYFEDMPEVFDKVLGTDGQGYVRRKTFTPEQAIRLIKAAGGLGIIAHPLLYKFDNEQLDTLVKNLKIIGLDGIEAYYYSFTDDETSSIKSLAEKYDLLISGGSDFHGDNRHGVDVGRGYGNLNIPYSLIEKMKERLK
ncbi:PHP domain-containing protein [Vallitalea okinawensis]|uniref:PHP domain-containing protein n=1 Tax=Vallitalea okinawensis TaxID=2078660 RepID=UPI000CFD9F6A|nr:PHP domain-containing protein [Vallitalea okinawensis]